MKTGKKKNSKKTEIKTKDASQYVPYWAGHKQRARTTSRSRRDIALAFSQNLDPKLLRTQKKSFSQKEKIEANGPAPPCSVDPADCPGPPRLSPHDTDNGGVLPSCGAAGAVTSSRLPPAYNPTPLGSSPPAPPGPSRLRVWAPLRAPSPLHPVAGIPTASPSRSSTDLLAEAPLPPPPPPSTR